MSIIERLLFWCVWVDCIGGGEVLWLNFVICS